MQFDLPLGPAAAPPPEFASEAEFTAMLGRWQSGKTRRTGQLRAARIETPLGTMVCVCSADHLHLLEFASRPELPREIADLGKRHGKISAGRTGLARRVEDQLARYFGGELRAFELPLAFSGSAFAKDVWSRLCKIPYGLTTTYGAIAAEMGRPAATRAVARANGANRIAIIVPCHRVIGADGALTGYAGGLDRKRALLTLETGVGAGT